MGKKKRRTIRRRYPCVICDSKVAVEVNRMIENRAKHKLIYEFFVKETGYSKKDVTFFHIIMYHYKHIPGLLPDKKMELLQKDKKAFDSVADKALTIQNFGRRVLEMGFLKLQNMDPDDLTLQDVISSQRLILDAKKLKLTEDAMTLAMSRMFGPPIEGEIIEGEGVDDVRLVRPGEDAGNKPENLE